MTSDSTLATGEILEPGPELSLKEIVEVAQDYFGRQVTAQFATSERDRNAILTDQKTGERTLLKVANPSESAGVTSLQIEALLHIAAVDPNCPVPRVVPACDGNTSVQVNLLGGRSYSARLLTYIPGRPMAGSAITCESAANTGELLAQLDRAMESFRHPNETRALIWDLNRAQELLDLTQHIPESAMRKIARHHLTFDANGLTDSLNKMRTQMIHSDFNPHNIIVDDLDPSKVVGVIDFGDIVRAPLICEVAIAASYMMDGSADDVDRVVALVRAYAKHHCIFVEEAQVLPNLMGARLAMAVTIPSWRAKLFPANATYIQRNLPRAVAALTSFDETAQQQMREQLVPICREGADSL